LGGYYPLIRRDVIESPPKKTITVAPRYYALNIISEYPETAEMPYELKHFDERSIVFESVQGHRLITKTYTLGEGPYSLNLDINIQGESRGLWLTSGIPEVEWISGATAPSLKYRLTRNQKSEV
jgi:YidC/Oxa1 family membrane protein insertase